MPVILRYLAAAGALAIGACGGCDPRRPREVGDEELLASAFDKPRFDRAQQVRPDPVNLDPALLTPDGWLEPKNFFQNTSFNGVSLDIGGRSFYFVSSWVSEKAYALRWVEPASGRRSETFVATIHPPLYPQGRLPFGVPPIPGGLVVVFPDRQAVREVRGAVTEAGLAFGEPRTISIERYPIFGLQLTPTDDRLHLIWTTLERLTDMSLNYSSAAPGDLDWSPPRALADTVQYGSGCMAAGDRDVYVAWCDFRHRKRRFWNHPINSGKVFVTASRDGGETFDSPVMLTDPRNHDDVGGTVDMVVGRGGVAVYWRLSPSGVPGAPVWWNRAALDFDLKRVCRGTTLAGTFASWH